jgi:hypothetical protein
MIIKLPVKELKRCISKISFAVNKNTEDEFYDYSSDICFMPLFESVDFVATNFSIIAVSSVFTKIPRKIRERSYRLPKDVVEYLLNLDDEDVEFKFDLDKLELFIQSKSDVITVDLIRCGFPDYRDVLLTSITANIEANVNRLAFYQAVVNNGEVELAYCKPKNKNFESLELIVNPLYLKQALENLSEYERVGLSFLDNIHQFSIHSLHFEEIYLMLPEKEITPEYKRMVITKDKILIKEV